MGTHRIFGQKTGKKDRKKSDCLKWPGRVNQGPDFHNSLFFLFLFMAISVSMIPVREVYASIDFEEYSEDLSIKKYIRADLLEKIEPGGWGSEEFIEQMKNAGLIIEDKKDQEKTERKLADLENFSFHKKGRFQFIRYSRDGKSLFVSYLYPSGDADKDDYAPHLYNRNVLAQWEIGTGELAAVWMVLDNPAYAAAMNQDDKTIVYHLDIYEKTDKGVEIIKNQLYLHDLTKDEDESQKILSLDKEDDMVMDAFLSLDNIGISPDLKSIVFSGQMKANPETGGGLIVDVATGKKQVYQYAYESTPPGMPNGAAMVFSPNGKELAVSIPEGKKPVTKIKINILDTGSWKVVRELDPVFMSFKYHDLLYSPDCKYLARTTMADTNGIEIFSTSSGKPFGFFPSLPGPAIFSSDSRFFLNFSSNDYSLGLIDTRSCIRLAGRPFQYPFDGTGLKPAFSPDNRKIAVAGPAKGVNTVQIIEFAVPDEAEIAPFRSAQRALELFKAGLTKEGISMAKEAIRANPSGLYQISYNRQMDEISMPPFLKGELFRRIYDQGLTEKNNRLGVSWEQKKEGLLITEIYPDTPAKKAGLAKGDIITGIDGKKTVSINLLIDIYNNLMPDHQSALEILRNGEPIFLDITPVKGISSQAFYALMGFALSALEARNPLISMQAMDQAKKWVKENRILVTRYLQEQLLIIEAGALAMMGKTEDAYTLIIAHNGFECFGGAFSAMMDSRTAFSILLKERAKLAVAMMLEKDCIPFAPEKDPSPQPHPDLSGTILEPLTKIPLLKASEPLEPSSPSGSDPSKPGSGGTILD